MDKNWIRLSLNDVSFFINKGNIAGISISPKTPTQLNIIMIGDNEATNFNFPSTEERNNKLAEILGDEIPENTKEIEP